MITINAGRLLHVQPDIIPLGERRRFIPSTDGPENPHGISCDGATSQIHFNSFSGFWDAVIDGVLVAANTEIPDIMIQISQQFEGKLLADWDGASYIHNVDSAPHRLVFIPHDNANYEYSAEYSTPAFTAHADGRLTFCLAAQPQLPADEQYVAYSVLDINQTNYAGLCHFPWFRVNKALIHHFPGGAFDTGYSELVSLIPATGADGHFPELADDFFAPTPAGIVTAINSILSPHGITASLWQAGIKLSSGQPFWTGSRDQDGVIIGQVFSPSGVALLEE